jgi:translin
MSGLDLELVETWARAELDAKNSAREQALRWSRELVRTCANSIRAVHRHEFGSAASLLGEAHALNERICRALAEHSDLYWAGYVQDAQKELVEACCTVALVQGEALPDPVSLGVAPAAFLNGLAEAVGELRRYTLDLLRRGKAEKCEHLLAAMDDIYGLLVTLDYPDALTGGLRRSTDNARGILEKTRGDLTLALRQDALVEALRSVERSAGET